MDLERPSSTANHHIRMWLYGTFIVLTCTFVNGQTLLILGEQNSVSHLRVISSVALAHTDSNTTSQLHPLLVSNNSFYAVQALQAYMDKNASTTSAALMPDELRADDTLCALVSSYNVRSLVSTSLVQI